MAIPKMHSAATLVAFVTMMLASLQAGACIASAPAVQRTHGVLLAGPAAAEPRRLRTMDLASIVLPGGGEDDWRVTLVESRPGTLRLLSAQEWERILASPGAETTTLGDAASAARAQFRLGALRAGEATLRLERVGGRGAHEFRFVVVDRPAPEEVASRRVPHPAGAPVPKC